MNILKRKIKKMILESLEKNLFKTGNIEKYDMPGKKFKNVKPALDSKNIETHKTKFKFDPNDPKIANAAQQELVKQFAQRMT